LLDGLHTYEEAEAGCLILGEELWSPELVNVSSIRPNLEYLIYRDVKKPKGTMWISATSDGMPRVLDLSSGSVSSIDNLGGGSDQTSHHHKLPRLAGLCTQTAPYSTAKEQNTSEQWRVHVNANGQVLTG